MPPLQAMLCTGIPQLTSSAHSRSLEMAKFDSIIAYHSAIVNIAVLYRFRIPWRWRISWPWNLGYGYSSSSTVAPFDRSHKSSYLSCIVDMAISYVVYAIKQDDGRKSWFFSPHLYITSPPWEKRLRIFSRCFLDSRDKPMIYQVLCLLTARARHRQTDRLTDGQT